MGPLGLCWLLGGWSPWALGALMGGPMVGLGATSDQVAVWLMTEAPAQVQIEYWPEANPTASLRSPTHITHPDSHTARVDLPELTPATSYGYLVLLEGEPVPDKASASTFTTPPSPAGPLPDLRIATGSCAYIPDLPDAADPNAFGGGFGIFDRIASLKPDLMIWLGDSIYYRDTDLGEDSATRMNARWAVTRSFPPLQRLLRTGQHLAIWDDHDYGPDNSDRGFALKDLSLRLFQRYWVNPSYGLPDTPGVFFKASMGDLELFLLDDRTYRDPDTAPPTPEKSLLGQTQLHWLKEGLKASQATFKLIANGSRMLSEPPSETSRGGEGWHNFPAERMAFLQWLQEEGIDGVFFLSGDVHYTYLTERERVDRYTLTELICSPLTSRVHPRPFPINEVPGTLVTERNFCILEVSGPKEQRVLTVSAWNGAGTRLWREAFPASALQGLGRRR